jgi:RNA polymerase sigma-70 factor, ECF subfamily
MDIEQEKEFIEKMKNGNPDEEREAFSKIYNEYNSHVIKYLSRRVLTINEQLDSAQDIWLRAWEKRHSFQHRGVPFGAWVIAIARNVVNEIWKGKYKVLSLPEDCELIDEGESVEDQVLDKIARESESELRTAILDAIGHLPDDYKNVIEARETAEMTSKETAELYGWNVDKVDVTFYRAKEALRNYLIRRYSADKVDDWLGKVNEK